MIRMPGKMEFEAEGVVDHPPNEELLILAGGDYWAGNVGDATASWVVAHRGLA